MIGATLGRRRWGRTLAACVALLFLAVLAALAAPVRLPEGAAMRDPSDVLPDPVAGAAPEDLRVFLASRRWGVSLDELLEADAPEPIEKAPTVNPILAEMGYVGLIVANGRRAVLLASPEGGVARVVPGDMLPDGRTLVSVTDNDLTLEAEGMPEEVLTLFPPVRPAGRVQPAGPES